MKALALWVLLAAPAPAAGDASPLVTHYHAVPAPSEAAEASSSTELAMADDGQDRLTVPVSIGASRPYRFLVDTGSNRTSVSHQLARELGLTERAGARLHSSTGRSTVRTAHLPMLVLSSRAVGDITAPLLDAAHIGADGILGIDALRAQRVSFDFERGILSIQSGSTPDAIDKDAIIVRAKRREGRLVVTDAELDGIRVTVVLDTGSSATVANAALRRKLERRREVKVLGPIELVSVTGAALRGEVVHADKLDIGGVRLEGLAVVFAEAHTFGQLQLDRKPALLLGMNALRSFDQVSVDFANRTLSLVLPRAERAER